MTSTPEISEPEFEAWEALILSEQIPQQDVPSLLDRNPKFAEWYRERAKKRGRS